MSYLSIFRTNENQKQKWDSIIYEISEFVSAFFWDEAPDKYGLEAREGQQDMAFAILDAVRGNYHFAVEAGVGIGKSFAYLVPLLLYNKKTGLPVIIATSTIALQEQLMDDIKRLSPMLNVTPDVLLAKGQTHYVCQLRANDYFASPEGQQFARLKQKIVEGCQDRRAFSPPIPANVWEKINIVRYSRRACLGCPFSSQCQYARLRDELKFTNGIILCNQDLLTAHLFKRSRDQGGLLSDLVQFVVVDEAHNLEDKVRSATTERFGERQLIHAINSAVKSVRGEEREFILEDADDVVRSVRALYSNLNSQMRMQITQPARDMKYADRFFFRDEDGAIDLIRAVSRQLQKLSSSVQVFGSRDYRRGDSSSGADELDAAAQSFKELASDFDRQLLWLERRGQTADLSFCPKNTKDILKKLYFSSKIRVILTSATLTSAVGGPLENQYAYFLHNTGFPVGRTGILSEPHPSPYPYDEHAMIYFCDDLPHPTRDHEAFIEKGVERLIQVLNISQGKALVLFTAKTDMEEVYAALQSRNLPYKILIQQNGASQERVLQAFRNDVNSVLLGTGAYWEGISIEGKSLSNLVIFRLPFPVPDPIIEYKASIAKDAMMDVRVPEMIIKLKQGIGRLIRNFSDTGIVSIIDSRLRDTQPERYHDITWNSLPIHRRTTDLQEIEAFYHTVCD